MSNDTLGDILTQIRNANLIKSPSIVIANNKISYQLAKILQHEGFIKSFNTLSNKYLVMYLKYKGREREPILTNLKRISKPGCRIYSKYKEIPIILGGLGILLLSTSKGILTNKEAYFRHLGGEILCSIW